MPIAITLALSRIVGAALACGTSLYASLAVAGIASRLGLLDLPPGLNGLQQWLLIGAALALFTVEVIALAMPWIGSAWEALNTIVRPLAAGLLIFVALEPMPLSLRLAGAALACLIAFAAHSARIGLQLTAALRTGRLALRAAEVTAASALILAALRAPRLAFGLAALFLAALAFAGPRLWRASAFAALASVALVRGFFEPRQWRLVHDLPRRLRGSLAPPEIGMPELKVARTALSGSAGDWRNGWLLFDGRSVRFLHTRRFRSTQIRLSRVADPAIRQGFLADTISLDDDPTGLTLHVFKDGPPAETIVGALQLVIE